MSVRQQVSDKFLRSVLAATMVSHEDYLSVYKHDVIFSAELAGHSISEVALEFGLLYTEILQSWILHFTNYWIPDITIIYQVSSKTKIFGIDSDKKIPWKNRSIDDL